MTNLLAAIIVTIVTNVTEAPVPVGYHAGPCPQGLNCLVFHGVADYDGKKKTVTTTVKKVTTCKFDWFGKSRETIEEEVLSQKAVYMERSEEWTVSTNKQPMGYGGVDRTIWQTNDMALGGTITNYITVNTFTNISISAIEQAGYWRMMALTNEWNGPKDWRFK